MGSRSNIPEVRVKSNPSFQESSVPPPLTPDELLGLGIDIAANHEMKEFLVYKFVPSTCSWLPPITITVIVDLDVHPSRTYRKAFFILLFNWE